MFTEPSQGCSLIHEDDLELVDRILDLGDPVKRVSDETMRGQVIGATTKCTLEPIAFRPVDSITGDYLPLRFTERPFSNTSDALPATETPEVGQTSRRMKKCQKVTISSTIRKWESYKKLNVMSYCSFQTRRLYLLSTHSLWSFPSMPNLQLSSHCQT
jgi:hypothetical protein